MKDFVILGSTGSIGTQCLDVIENNKDKFRAVVLSCEKRIDELLLQIEKFSPEVVVVSQSKDVKKIIERFPTINVLVGDEGLVQASQIKCHMVINSLVGIKGLKPTWAAIEAGNNIGLANKETLVAGGKLIMDKAKENNVDILPIDSEHSAIYQCLNGEKIEKLNKIILTASGGPFRGKKKDFLTNVKLEDALKHPKWTMGAKITVDSSTLMNKGLEVIEARWLFNTSVDKIDVLVHPQSIVHSMVEFVDGSVIAQLGNPDMKIPISYAMEYPNRLNMESERLNLIKEGTLTFEEPDKKTFVALELSYEACRRGEAFPVVLNAANEALVDLFLRRKIEYLEIQNNLERVMEMANYSEPKSIEDVVCIDEDIKRTIYNMYNSK